MKELKSGSTSSRIIFLCACITALTLTGCGGGGSNNNNNDDTGGSSSGDKVSGEIVHHDDSSSGSGGIGVTSGGGSNGDGPLVIEPPLQNNGGELPGEVADTGSVGGSASGNGCNINALNESIYESVAFGTPKSTVQQMIGCQSSMAQTNGDGTSWIAWDSEEPYRATMNIAFDTQANVYLKGYLGKVLAMPATMTTPVAPACTTDHINRQRADMLFSGMTMDQINQAIGCTPNLVDRFAVRDGAHVYEATAYTWGMFTDASMYSASRFIKVEFSGEGNLAANISAGGF